VPLRSPGSPADGEDDYRDSAAGVGIRQGRVSGVALPRAGGWPLRLHAGKEESQGRTAHQALRQLLPIAGAKIAVVLAQRQRSGRQL